jgi:hypothetical protein
MTDPDWVNNGDGAAGGDEEQPLSGRQSMLSRISFAPTLNEAMETDNTHVSPSSQRIFSHKLFRLFKCITILIAMLLLIAQILSLVYLPFDGVELLIKIFLSSFCVLIVMNELEWWSLLKGSALFWNWIPRGYFYAFIGVVSVEENNLKPSGVSLNALPFDYTAALFIETTSWMMFAVGILYMSLGLCCCQVYQTKVREHYKERLAERKKVFEEGLNTLEFRHDLQT